MKIRLVSDLHIDINSAYPLDFKHEGLDDMFTVVAGDICGSPEKAAEWLKCNVSHGAFVSGNHDVYDTDMSIEDVKTYFAKEFPADSDMTYFDSDVGVISKDLDSKTLLVADVLYTDYKLPVSMYNPNGDIKCNLFLADSHRNGKYGMNDFNCGKCKKAYAGVNDSSSCELKRLVPEWCLDHHERAFSEITRIVEENSSRDIILATHHCMSPKCIDDEHEDCSVLASYVSDKESWIIAHPNVKCICSGHIHTRRAFHIGSTLYVMNALGYCRNHLTLWSDETKSYVPWTPDCIIDTETWTVEFKPHDMPEWMSTYTDYNKWLLGNLSLFM